ncbi:hypothetical protein Ahy_A07g031820 isoform C [Arachis hypogaea]|uniref:Uncharacterized protein n=1 Tax=Arachis hypogaea TaxID=3818 RepID=A0A445C580_ARAHY|nr:hypothetical protein Ahy_A07g031820 isoform C [Arachis hypogaea]
MRVAICSG